MCEFCGKEWKEIPSGSCPDEWKCPDCGKEVSPCCGAKIYNAIDDSANEVHQYCGTETCSKCFTECHCGGCV